MDQAMSRQLPAQLSWQLWIGLDLRGEKLTVHVNA